MYVPGLKKFFISIVILEDRGYDVASSKGKAFFGNVATEKMKQIGFRGKNIYKLEVKMCRVEMLDNSGISTWDTYTMGP